MTFKKIAIFNVDFTIFPNLQYFYFHDFLLLFANYVASISIFFYDFTNFFLPDPLKRIEIFKAVTSPAYIVATLENVNDVSSDFFCPVKKCFEFAVEASAKGKAMPEYKREYREIEQR